MVLLLGLAFAILGPAAPGPETFRPPVAFASRADTRYVSAAHESALAPPAQSAQGGSHGHDIGTILSCRRVLE